MTDTETLIARLERAHEQSIVMWCNVCGRTSLSVGHRIGAEIVNEGNSRDCRGAIQVGSPAEAITALKARARVPEIE